MTTLIHRRVEELRRGENPKLICRVPSGWVVMGDVQFLTGYVLLLPDPVTPSLNEMDPEARALYLRDMALIGDALLEVTDAYRINYEILGNSEPALHAHILPRYSHEPDEYRTRPAWFYDWQSAPPFDAQRDRPLMEKIADAVQKRVAEAARAA